MDKNRWFEKAAQEGFESFEIYQLLSEERKFTWFEGTLDTYVVSHVLGTSFRGVIDEKLVNASSEDTGDEQMDEVLSSMKSQAAMITSDVRAALTKPQEISSAEKKKPASFHADEIRSFLKRTEEKILAYDERIFQVGDLEYEEGRERRTIVNSLGLDVCDTSGINVLVASAAARQGEEIRTHYEFEAVEDIHTFDLDEFVRTLCEGLLSQLGAVTPDSGTVPVIIDRKALTSLIRAFSPMFCGESVRKGISPLCGKTGTKVFSGRITIIDDPACSEALQQWPFDDEGCPAKRKLVVDHGVLKTILHSKASASAMNTESTGNGFRSSYSAPVDAAPRNFWIEPGEKTQEELMAEMGEGILITGFAGLHAGLDHVSGDFSLQCSGFAVRDGKKAEGLTLFTAAGNILTLLSSVQAVGSDLKRGLSSTVAPSVWFESLAISGK
jgi:PmbA protein